MPLGDQQEKAWKATKPTHNKMLHWHTCHERLCLVCVTHARMHARTQTHTHTQGHPRF